MRGRILVVDDEPSILLTLAAILEREADIWKPPKLGQKWFLIARVAVGTDERIALIIEQRSHFFEEPHARRRASGCAVSALCADLCISTQTCKCSSKDSRLEWQLIPINRLHKMHSDCNSDCPIR